MPYYQPGKKGLADERWYWAALAILDGHFYPAHVQKWFGLNDPKMDWRGLIKSKQDSDADGNFAEHVDSFREFFNNPERLGEIPGDLVDVLAKAALASPAVVALRSFNRRWPGITPVSMFAAAKVAVGFRSMYNLPETITLIRGINDQEPYWKRLLEYGAEGNLQAVMDEYLHVLYESLGLSGQSSDEAVSVIADTVAGAVSLRTVNLDYDSIRKYRIDLSPREVY